jgi:hypothetical protein
VNTRLLYVRFQSGVFLESLQLAGRATTAPSSITWQGLEATALAWLHRALAQAKALDFFFSTQVPNGMGKVR